MKQTLNKAREKERERETRDKEVQSEELISSCGLVEIKVNVT